MSGDPSNYLEVDLSIKHNMNSKSPYLFQLSVPAVRLAFSTKMNVLSLLKLKRVVHFFFHFFFVLFHHYFVFSKEEILQLENKHLNVMNFLYKLQKIASDMPIPKAQGNGTKHHEI